MIKILKVKPIFNKKNGQINFSLPKKKLSKKFIKELKLNPQKMLKIKLEELDF